MFIKVLAVVRYVLITKNAMLITNSCLIVILCLDQYVIGWASDEAATYGVRIFDKCTNQW